MTSLIFGSIYMGHQAFVEHRHSKQREKNYQRWEGLRDEYDEEKKERTRRSLDSSLDSSEYWQAQQQPSYQPEQRDLFTLRDRQEAGDARTSWRPQETESYRAGGALPNSFTGAVLKRDLTGQPTGRSSSMGPIRAQPTSSQSFQGQSTQYLQPQPTSTQSTRPSPNPLVAQSTGTTWDDGLPARLNVSRRSFEDYNYPNSTSNSNSLSTPVSRTPSTSARRPSPLSNGSNSNSSARISTENLSLSSTTTNGNSSNETKRPNGYDTRRPTEYLQRVASVEVVESPFEWWKS